MRTSQLARILAMGTLLLGRPSGAGAQEVACERVSVEPSPDLDASWLPAVEHLRATLARELMGPECVPLRLLIERTPSGVVLRAQTFDGREATRPVSGSRALVPVAFGLLASAPEELGAPRRPAPESAPERRSVALVETDAHDLPDFSVPTPERKAASPSVGVALGLSTGVRVGFPTDVVMWDSELRLDVFLHDWFVLAFMRYAPIGSVSGIAADLDAYEEIGVGFGIGREFRRARHTLDLSASPSVVFASLEADSPTEKNGEVADFRINVAARYGYSLGAGWRFTLVVDSDAAPSSLLKARYPDPALPAMPAWTLGFRLGAATSLL